MKLIKALIIVQIELLWWKIRCLQKRARKTQKIRYKISIYRKEYERLSLVYEVLEGYRKIENTSVY